MPPRKAAPASIPTIELPPPVKTIEKPKRKLPDFIMKVAVPVEPEVEMESVDEEMEDLELEIKRAQAYYDWAEKNWKKCNIMDEDEVKKLCKDGASPDEIVDFVWKHTPEEDRSEFACKVQLKNLLTESYLSFFNLMDVALEEAEIKSGPGRAIAYNGATNFCIWVEHWLDENLKTKEQRRDTGEIVAGSDDEEELFETFFITDGEEACGTSPDKIFDFIWRHIGKEGKKKFGSRDQLEYVLSCEPKDLLKYLQSALDEASWHIGPLIP